MNHASLFSGIGGFDLAAEWSKWENIFHCEWNPFCQKVLKYHFPKSKSYEDITKTDFNIYRRRIDVLTGGFPCQPYSTAGLRKGKEDERHLWPEMLRAIREIQPRWIVGENVRGLVNWGGGGWYSKRCKLIWKTKVMKFNRLLFLLQVSTLRTEGIGSGLLLTPTTREQVQDLEKFKARMEKYPNGTTMPNLATQVIGILPTPSAFDWNTAQRQDKYKERREMQKEKGVSLHYPLKQMAMDINPNGKTSQLSPQFVGEMMGFPENWTELPFLIGEKNQSKPMETQ